MRAAALALLVSFHHLHLNEVSSSFLLNYYSRLFTAGSVSQTLFGDVEGIESSGIFLLINRVPRKPPEDGPVWHFGWGDLSMAEAYDGHRFREEWDPPFESLGHGLHLHLESEDPAAAAAWYRDQFGAEIETAPDHQAVQPVSPVFRRPLALVTLQGIKMAIYRAMENVPPSTGRRVDHIAFRADLAAVRRIEGLKVLKASGRLGPFETTTVEGPDGLAIELVGAPALKR